MKIYRVGYTAGVFDMFHIGHLNLIKKAKSMCDELIVGVNSDKLVLKYKHKLPITSFEDRIMIVDAIKYVDKAVENDNLDKLEAWNRYHFDVVFIGSDWKGSERWNETEKQLAKIGAKVEYIPYTENISSTQIRERLIKNKIIKRGSNV